MAALLLASPQAFKSRENIKLEYFKSRKNIKLKYKLLVKIFLNIFQIELTIARRQLEISSLFTKKEKSSHKVKNLPKKWKNSGWIPKVWERQSNSRYFHKKKLKTGPRGWNWPVDFFYFIICIKKSINFSTWSFISGS